VKLILEQIWQAITDLFDHDSAAQALLQVPQA